jgi:hypothetical protein
MGLSPDHIGEIEAELDMLEAEIALLTDEAGCHAPGSPEDCACPSSGLDNGLGKLREALAHRCGDVRRPAADAAGDGWQWSVV